MWDLRQQQLDSIKILPGIVELRLKQCIEGGVQIPINEPNGDGRLVDAGRHEFRHAVICIGKTPPERLKRLSQVVLPQRPFLSVCNAPFPHLVRTTQENRRRI